MKPTVLVTLALAATVAAQAQTWNEGYANQPANLRYGSLNPTRIAYNTVHDYAVADLDYSLSRGDFHAIDQSGNAHALAAYIGGLRQIGRFDVAGHLSYQNHQDNDQSWNSTLWNNPYNPFILCDSIPGDATTEAYDLGATAAYTFSDRVKAALAVNLRTGSRSDQADPRPRSVTTQLPITAGVDYRLTNDWSVGLAASIHLFSSLIEYTSVNSTLHSHRYFLMKGMGDYAKRSSGDESGYSRDYKGTDYRAALSAVWQPAGGHWRNLIEASVALNSEEATDGGASYQFRSGDYAETVLAVTDRLQWQPNANTLHNLTLTAALADGKATWCDQKRELDLELGSAVLYRVLSESTIQKNQRLAASVGYQLDLLCHGRRDVTVDASASLHSLSRKQYLGTSTPEQKIQYVDLQAQVAKTLYINKVSLLLQVGGDYRLPGTKQYAHGSAYTGDDDIERAYTRHVFEYESAGRFSLHAMADASLPVSPALTAGLYAKGRYEAYTDNEEYWTGYDGTRLTTVNVGLYLKF